MRAVPHGGMPSPPSGTFTVWPAPPRRSRAPLWVLLAILVAALVALGVWGVRGAFSSGGSTPQPNAPRGSGGAPRGQAAPAWPPGQHAAARAHPPESPAEHATVEVEATAYLDLPAREASARLARVGLAPNVLPDTTGTRQGDPRYCTVTEVTPTGAVPIGSGVTVRCRPIEPAS
jgi:serine/threonine-protein kinase